MSKGKILWKEDVWEITPAYVEDLNKKLEDWSVRYNVPKPSLVIDDKLPFDAIYLFDDKVIKLQKFWKDKRAILRSLKHEFYHHLSEYGRVPFSEKSAERFRPSTNSKKSRLPKGVTYV